VSFDPGGVVEQHRSGSSRNYRLDPWVIGLSALNVIIFVALTVAVLAA
jgi:hypothetical protein